MRLSLGFKSRLQILCTLSQNPLAWGLYAQVWFSLQPKKLHNSFHKCEVNLTPRSQANSVGQPNLATQVCKNASAHSLALVPLRGATSTCLVNLSMKVIKYENRDGTGQDFFDLTRPVNFKIIAG